jgi:hypothetical protein
MVKKKEEEEKGYEGKIKYLPVGDNNDSHC